MHTYRPPRINRAHIIMPIILILICFTCLWASKAAPVIPAYIPQIIGVASAAVAIQIMTRYSLTSFLYEINDESVSLKITKRTGKKNVLTADIEFTDIKHIDKKEKGYSVKKKYGKPYRAYNFCNNIYPRDTYCLVCDIEGDDIAVIIEADEIFLNILKSNTISKGDNIQ